MSMRIITTANTLPHMTVLELLSLAILVVAIVAITRGKHSCSLIDSMATLQELSTLTNTSCTLMRTSPRAVHSSMWLIKSNTFAVSVSCMSPRYVTALKKSDLGKQRNLSDVMLLLVKLQRYRSSTLVTIAFATFSVASLRIDRSASYIYYSIEMH